MPKPAGADSPPTPAVGLGALLADQALELRLVAGPDRAEVHGVHASEMTDPSPYLLGGELLLTAGAGDAADAADAADAYVRRLVGSGVAALGFGVAPLHAQVPPALAEACVRHGLPLLEVPPQTRFTAVARAVWRLMAGRGSASCAGSPKPSRPWPPRPPAPTRSRRCWPAWRPA